MNVDHLADHRLVAGRQAQRCLGRVEPLGREQRQRLEAGVCGRVTDRSGDRPAHRVGMSSRITGTAARMRTRPAWSSTMVGSKNTAPERTRRSVVRCSRPAGIQAACCGGSRWRPVALSTSATPENAYWSWCMSWWCHGVTRSSPSSRWAPARTGDPSRMGTRIGPVPVCPGLAGTGGSLAGPGGTTTGSACHSPEMGSHDDAVRRSFDRQTSLFSGPDSPFAARPPGALLVAGAPRRRRASSSTWPAARPTSRSRWPRSCIRSSGSTSLARSSISVPGASLEARSATSCCRRATPRPMPFVDESFDLVCCRSSLHHFADPVAGGGRDDPGLPWWGRVVVQDIVSPNPSVRDRYDELHRLIDPSHRRAFLEPEIADLFGGIGVAEPCRDHR